MTKVINLNYELWPKQLEAFRSPATERLYGGAAGGGKSHLERVESIALCLDIPGLNYFLFRRNFQDLVKSYIEGPSGYRQLLGPLIHDPDVKNAEIVAKEMRFPIRNGLQSKIFLCHCQHAKDVFKFGSFEFHVLNIAEAGEFEKFMIEYLRSRVRAPKEFLESLPEKYQLPKEFWKNPDVTEYQIPKILLSANPVGPGKDFLKKSFVDKKVPNKIYRMSDAVGGMLRQFIPARLNDNPSLDPIEYAAKLKGIGSKAYVDALLEGRWDVPIGAFFPQIDKSIHLIRPIMIPSHWPRFMAYDHGACGQGDPFSCGWYTIVGDPITIKSAYTNQPLIAQRGSMICYRRWNGNGLPKMDAAQIADGIDNREKGEPILFRVAGGDIMEARGHGESIFSIFSKKGINFRRADMRRQNGWAQVDYRLYGENGYPLSFWFEECEEDLDTISNVQYHDNDPGDIAGGDDHDADRHRYACMTRPIAKEQSEEKQIDYRDKNKRTTVKTLVAHINQPQKKFKYVGR